MTQMQKLLVIRLFSHPASFIVGCPGMDSEMDIEFSPLEILDEKRAWLEIESSSEVKMLCKTRICVNCKKTSHTSHTHKDLCGPARRSGVKANTTILKLRFCMCHSSFMVQNSLGAVNSYLFSIQYQYGPLHPFPNLWCSSACKCCFQQE